MRVWNVETGECKETTVGHAGGVGDVCCAPDGQLAVTSGFDETLRVWDLQSGECKKTLISQRLVDPGWRLSGRVCCIPTGLSAISAHSKQNTLRVWDLQSGECKKTLLIGHVGDALYKNVFCTPDGQLAVSVSYKTLHIFDLETSELKETLTSKVDSFEDVCCTPDGRIAISVNNSDLAVWDLETGECKKTLTNYGAHNVCCTPDGKLVYQLTVIALSGFGI